MRIAPQQYFQEPGTSVMGDNTLHLIIIAIIAGIALGLAIAKK